MRREKRGSPDVDVKWLKGLPLGRLLDVAGGLAPQEDAGPGLRLDVPQVRAPRPLHLLVHVEGGQRLVQANKDLDVHETLRGTSGKGKGGAGEFGFPDEEHFSGT